MKGTRGVLMVCQPQEFMILPVGAANFREAMCIGAEVPKKREDLSYRLQTFFLGGIVRTLFFFGGRSFVSSK